MMESPILPGLYRSADPIDNLLVRVSLRSLKRPTVTPNSPSSSTNASPLLECTADIGWQQKIYSPRELVRSAAVLSRRRERAASSAAPDDELPLSPSERENVEDLERRLAAGEPVFEASATCVIFTYCDRDGHVLPELVSPEGGELPGAFSGIETSAAALADSGGLASALFDPHARSLSAGVNQRATPAAVKDGAYQTMYIMAAINVDATAFRERREDMQMTEVCLCAVRAYERSSLIEVRPGFAQPVPYDRASLMALARTVSGEAPYSGAEAAALLIGADTRLGSGKFGGTLRLQPLSSIGVDRDKKDTEKVLPPDFSSSQRDYPARRLSSLLPGDSILGASTITQTPPPPPERSSDVVAFAIESHRFSLADGSVFEFSVSNADEDIGAVLRAAASVSGTTLSPALQAAVGAESTEFLVSDSGVVSADALREADVRSLELASHRLGSDFFSRVPRHLLLRHPNSFCLSIFVEIVAAARFEGPNAVYVSWELALPKGSGWRLLPQSDVPDGSARSIAGVMRLQGNNVGKQLVESLDWDSDPLHSEAERRARGELDFLADVGADMSPPAGDSDGLRQRFSLKSPAADPDKRGEKSACWGLHPTPVAGVTQVARFVSRPWTFGSQSAVDEQAKSLRSNVFQTDDEAKNFPGQTHVSSPRSGMKTGVQPAIECRGSLVSSGNKNAYSSRHSERTSSSVSSVPPPTLTPVAHFSYPIEFHLANDSSESNVSGLPALPTLLLTALSRDAWDRHRAEGYGFADIPTSAQSQNILVPCWAPRGDTESDFFLGSGSRLSDTWHARYGMSARAGGHGDNENRRDAFASRLGLQTESAGEIALRVSAIVQRGPQPQRRFGQQQGLVLVAAEAASTRLSSSSATSVRAAPSVDAIIAESKALRRRERAAPA